MAQLEKAKVFMSGRSQAVRVPAKFRFSSKEVFIRRDLKNGDLVLSQGPGSFAEIFAALDQLGVPKDFLPPPRTEHRVGPRNGLGQDVPLHVRHQHGQLYCPGPVPCRPCPDARVEG
jgi:antitoxin VapB